MYPVVAPGLKANSLRPERQVRICAGCENSLPVTQESKL
jgi:hypothetical protein